MSDSEKLKEYLINRGALKLANRQPSNSLPLRRPYFSSLEGPRRQREALKAVLDRKLIIARRRAGEKDLKLPENAKSDWQPKAVLESPILINQDDVLNSVLNGDRPCLNAIYDALDGLKDDTDLYEELRNIDRQIQEAIFKKDWKILESYKKIFLDLLIRIRRKISLSFIK